jgi:hypothetical protein
MVDPFKKMVMADYGDVPVSVDKRNLIHQRCEIQNRAEALGVVKNLSAGITKIMHDVI